MLKKQKGFYISLACGVAAIAAFAGMCASLKNSEIEETPIAVAESATPKATITPEPDTEETSANNPISEVKETSKPTRKAVQTNSTLKKEILHFSQEKGLLWPVDGDVIMEYSADKVIYFKTLAQYRVNPAVVISAKEGSDVKASADGVVKSVSTSEETGRTVVLSLGDDFTVTYGQLKDVAVSQGDPVEEGEVIGKIAKPTKYYTEEGANLYLQVKEKDETVNPLLLLR